MTYKYALERQLHFNLLPPEVIQGSIYAYVHPIELWRHQRVCRLWKAWITNYFRTLKALFLNDDLSEYYLTPTGLHSIVHSLQWLREIRLNRCHHSVTEKALMLLAGRCHRLEVLSVPRSREVTDRVLREIGQNCPRVRELNLTSCFQISESGLQSVARGCKNLTELKVSRCFGVTDKGLIALFQGCPLLRDLDIGWCYRVTDESLKLIPSRVPHLTSLRIKGCGSVSDRTVGALCSAGVSVNNFY